MVSIGLVWFDCMTLSGKLVSCLETATNLGPSTRAFRESTFIVPLTLLFLTETSLKNDKRSRVRGKFPIYSSSSKSRMAVVVTNDALSLKAASSKVK